MSKELSSDSEQHFEKLFDERQRLRNEMRDASTAIGRLQKMHPPDGGGWASKHRSRIAELEKSIEALNEQIAPQRVSTSALEQRILRRKVEDMLERDFSTHEIRTELGLGSLKDLLRGISNVLYYHEWGISGFDVERRISAGYVTKEALIWKTQQGYDTRIYSMTITGGHSRLAHQKVFPDQASALRYVGEFLERDKV